MDKEKLVAPSAAAMKRPRAPDSSARESSESDSEGTSNSSRSHKKRRRRSKRRSTSKESELDRRFDCLSQQLVSYLNNIVQANFVSKDTNVHTHATVHTQATVAPNLSKVTTTQDVTSSLSRENFLHPPSGSKIPNISEPSVSVKEPTVPKASSDRVAKIVSLQRFDTPEWNSVRYIDIQKKYVAFPAFSELRINEELRSLEDPFSSFKLSQIERSYAALSNAFLAQNEYVNSALQSLINWSEKSEGQLTPISLYENLKNLFGNESKFTSVSQDILQIICGKRAEVLESRRRALLKNLKQKYMREDLDRAPPSSEYIFNPEALSAYISKIGGLDKLDKKFSTRTARLNRLTSPEPSSSNSFRNKPFRAQASKKNQFRDKDFPGRKDYDNSGKKSRGQKNKFNRKRRHQNK
ncbi:uncharacterized protein [Epargyreus clarus]|uniref:uncharacterized protein n=1 Tax=Epargyreus clarus TaxID=520877 RepID=UPI003C2FED51